MPYFKNLGYKVHTKSESFQDKLQQLTQFNQALIYGFDPEKSHREELGSQTYQDVLFPRIGQFEDMLAGYLFAQNKLLPVFSKTEELDELSFINSIKQLHGYLGSTLFALAQEKSGEFYQQQVLRWKVNLTYQLTFSILSGITYPSLNGKNPLSLLIELLTTELSLSEKQVRQFVTLLQRLKNHSTIIPRASQKEFIDSALTNTKEKHLSSEGKSKLAAAHAATITIEKLAVAYLSNKLSAEERALVSKIVTICRDPEDIPKLMDAFAKNTLANWRKCNKKDIKEVSQFLAEMFYQFTDIHPFGNANGRTAGCLVNVFLISIGLPSILMRNPGERNDSSSSFSQAINAINQSREPLANHIYQRILEAQSQPFVDNILAETISLRCKMAHQLKSLQSEYPQIDINDYRMTMCQCAEDAISEYPTNEYRSLFSLNKFLRFLTQEENRLEQSLSKEMAKVTSSTSTTTSTSTQPVQLKGGFFTSVKTEGNKAQDAAKAEKCSDQSLSKGKTTVTGFIGTTTLTAGEMEQLKQDLSSLTNTGGWKISSKNHLDSWMETPNETEAESVSKLLKAAGVGNVTKKKRSDNNQIHVVICSNINLSELKNKIKSNNAAEAVAPNSAEAEVKNPTAQQ